MSADLLEQIGHEITSRVEELDKLGAKAVDHVDSIDYLLVEDEKLCDTAEAFAAFKQKRCPELGRSRTYELLAIKEGRNSREEIRALNRARVAKHRAGKKAVADKPSITSQAAAAECLEQAADLKHKAQVIAKPIASVADNLPFFPPSAELTHTPARLSDDPRSFHKLRSMESDWPALSANSLVAVNEPRGNFQIGGASRKSWRSQ
jgi:hypothetical protein